MVLRWNANTAFTDWKIKDDFKYALIFQGGLGYQETWLKTYLLL